MMVDLSNKGHLDLNIKCEELPVLISYWCIIRKRTMVVSVSLVAQTSH